MGQEQYLIDSNVIIDYLNGKLPIDGMIFMGSVVDKIPIISVISQIEVLGFKAPPEDALLLNDFMDVAQIIGLPDNIIKQTIELRKEYKIKTPDAIVAATAQLLNLTLISRNIKDFDKIKDLRLINPYFES